MDRFLAVLGFIFLLSGATLILTFLGLAVANVAQDARDGDYLGIILLALIFLFTFLWFYFDRTDDDNDEEKEYHL